MEPPPGSKRGNTKNGDAQLAEQCAAIWSDDSISMGERQAKISALRKRYG